MRQSILIKPFSYFICLSFFILTSCEKGNSKSNYQLTPLPKKISLQEKVISVKGGITVQTKEEKLLLLQEVLDDYFIVKENDNSSKKTLLFPSIDTTLSKNTYKLSITLKSIILKAGSYVALANGTTTLLQLIDENNQLKEGEIEDSPSFQYRGLMLDLSRSWYDVSSVKQIISLCSWYKINHLQMHLTDDGLFTFSSDAFPKLASKKHYTKEDLKELNQFAFARGVTLVPEIDVPGHSSGFIRTMPKLFGLNNVSSNSYTLNMGKEEVYKALDVLFGEVADAFPHSPYIHIGGDEVFTEGFLEDEHVKAYLKNKKLNNVKELYRHFLVRVTDIIKSKGKKSILWSGFEREGKVKIPTDVIIMNWKPAAYSPQEMIDDGYTIINASWQPLYIVNNRKWDEKTIYNWSPYEWKGFQTPYQTEGLKAKKNNKIIGGSMEIWEQSQYKAFSSLINRLPAMSEKLWNTNSQDFNKYQLNSKRTKETITNMIFPFSLQENGLTFSFEEPNFSEDMWFQDSLKISVKPLNNSFKIYYTLDGSKPTLNSTVYNKRISISNNTKLALQAFKNNEPKGQTLLKDYRLVPITFDIKGLANKLQPKSWEKHKFKDSIIVTLNSKLKGEIRYTTDNSTPTTKSNVYTKPFTVKHSGLIRARLFDENQQPIGSERNDEYEILQLETSLTTNKPVTTSNKFEAGVTELINDGKITRWDHWGAHTNGNNWVIIDLESEQTINAFKVYTFWDGYRYYEYTIEISSDNKNWKMVVDRSKNREKSTPKGQLDSIKPTKARYLKLNLIRNSSNPGLHLVEFQAF